MKLNRYNYEEYFILYLDNELDADARREVEAFAANNPDLKAELDLLRQSKLSSDTEISFGDKDLLLHFEEPAIHLDNYEEWFVSYIDSELNSTDRRKVENFIAANPALKAELLLLERAKLEAEEISFPDKASLFRKEEKAKVIPFRWIRIAVAAALLLAISVTALLLRDNGGSGPIVASAPGTGKAIKSTDPTITIKPGADSRGSVVAVKSSEPEAKTRGSIDVAKSARTVANSTETITKSNARTPTVRPGEEQNDAHLLANNNDNRKSSEEDTQVTPKIPQRATETNTEIPSLTNAEGNRARIDVTSRLIDTYNNTSDVQRNNDNPDVTFASERTGNKGVRGFLRKVTRTFEKRTNIKATDDDDRLLIAGLAIKMN